MTAAIIDDERPAITLLSAYIQRTKSLVLKADFTDPMDALEHFTNTSYPDLIFLDIDMPGINGIDLARIIGSRARIILTTSFQDYGPEAYELSICDYLLKPFSYERFLAALAKVPTGVPSPTPHNFFYVRSETRGKYLRLNSSDIICAESKDNFVLITSESGTATVLHTLADINAWLPDDHFFKIHRSYLINLNKITSVDHGRVQMNNGSSVPIGRQFRTAFINMLNTLLVSGR